MRRFHFRQLAFLASLAIVVVALGAGCATDGSSSVHVRYGIGMSPWWPYDYYWDRGPIHVGPPVYPEWPPEPALPIEPPPEFIAVPYMD